MCWLANVVVAIPVVFIPLAVFLTRLEEQDGCTIYEVFENEAENTEASDEKHYMDQSTETEIEYDEDHDFCCKLSAVDILPEGRIYVCMNAPLDGSQHLENLRLYLGDNIIRPMEDDDDDCFFSKKRRPSKGNDSVV